jgi:hypothetical protein
MTTPQMIAKSAPEFPLTSKETLVSISGSGNVGQYTALKVIELGATVVSLSDSKGALLSETGFTKEIVEKIGELKLKGGYLESLASEPGYTYHAGKYAVFNLIKGIILIDFSHLLRQKALDTAAKGAYRVARRHAERGFGRGGRSSCQGWSQDRCRGIQHGGNELAC